MPTLEELNAAYEAPDAAQVVTVSTYHMGDLAAVASVAHSVLKAFGGRFECDPELNGLMRN